MHLLKAVIVTIQTDTSSLFIFIDIVYYFCKNLLRILHDVRVINSMHYVVDPNKHKT